ncbi:CHAD domain-containing protein [Anabaena sp. FACHB-1237]|nr:CHAD domain-containing protein [Anabaena sp. FACHB-1237]
MEVSVEIPVKTLADYAYQAIDKHFQKTMKWEKSVKKDEDPEALHQMRVGIRRLRTAINQFSRYLDLPETINDKNIRKIARILGNLRDLDVLKQMIENDYLPHLLKKEKTSLKVAFAALEKQRGIAVTHVYQMFKDELYRCFKVECQSWLDHPIYQPFTFIPVNHILPELLMPMVSEFCLHSGWLVGTEILGSQILINEKITPMELEKTVDKHGEILHGLRKKAKSLRYQMELFSELYSDDFSNQILAVKQIQEVLGMLQDIVVLQGWLSNIFKSEMDSELGGLKTLLAVNRYKLWQEWQPIQKHFLLAETRYDLHLTVLQVN